MTGTLSFEVALSTTRPFIVQGKSAKVNVSIKRSDGLAMLQLPMSMKITGLPAGVTAAPVMLAPNASSVDIELLATAEMKHGEYTASLEINVDKPDGIPLSTTKKLTPFVRGPAGSIDTTYGVDGYVRTVLGDGPNPYTFEAGASPGDKLLVLAQCGGPGTGGTCIARFDEKGALDSTFGVNGVFVLDQRYPSFGSVAANGSLLFVGGGAFCRLTPAGKLDPAFGVEGCLDANEGSPAFGFGWVRLHTDGTTLGTEYSENGLKLTRLLSSGAIDPNFGLNGSIYIHGNIVAGNHAHALMGLSIRADGSTVGVTSFTGPSAGFATFRFLSNGNIDETFTSRNTLIQTCSGIDCPHDVVERPDGSMVAMVTHGSSGLPDLLGYTSLGRPDNGFGNAGISGTPSGVSGSAFRLMRMSDGRLVTLTDQRELLRFTSAGAVDPELGGSSVKIVLDPSLKIGAGVPVLVKDDRIILAFTQTLSSAPPKKDFLLVRIWN